MNPAPLTTDARQEARDKAVTEAHARIVWGDEPAEGVAYLKVAGFSTAEASDLVRGFVKERNADIRARGLRKTIIGALCLPAAWVCWYVEMHSSSVTGSRRGGGLSVAVGLALWGLWCLINGLWMLFSPRSEHGDLADGD
jgi:hypothetical protein